MRGKFTPKFQSNVFTKVIVFKNFESMLWIFESDKEPDQSTS